MDNNITIQRPAYSWLAFKDKYARDMPPNNSTCQNIKSCLATKCTCSKHAIKQTLFRLFPFINIMKSYQWKKWIILDAISALCLSILQIPLGLGFSVLASLPPQYGLYATIFPLIVYFFFGTSRHISLGTMAIISILISNVVEVQVQSFDFVVQGDMNSTDSKTDETASEELANFKVDIAMSLTFIVGAMQIAMSILRLGVLASFMSMPFIAGFMAGAAMHIYTSQIPFCLGISVAKQTGTFKFLRLWYSILKSLPQSNPAEVVTAVITFVIMILIKEVVNEKFKHKLKVPIPAELLVVAVSIVISHFAQLHDRYSIRILKDIPRGLPKPRIPEFENAQSYLVDAFVIGIMVFVINVSLAKLFSQKHQYPIDQNQEMLAYGIVHMVGSLFGSFAGAQAPPRTIVHDSAGGKSQLAGLLCAGLLLLVVYFLAPLFYSLPNSVLGAVILAVLISLLKRFGDLPQMWRISKADFLVWVITFLAVIILDIDIGLAIGIGISILSLVFQTHRASVDTLGNVENSELYVSCKNYKNLSDTHGEGLFVVTFRSALHFANVERFKEQLFLKTINPAPLLKKQGNQVTIEKIVVRNDQTTDAHDKSKEMTNGVKTTYVQDKDNNAIQNHGTISNNLPPSTVYSDMSGASSKIPNDSAQILIIMDCSAMTYVDLMGLNLLKHLRNLYNESGVEFLLANCDRDLMDKLTMNDTSVDEFVYPSVQDAVAKRHERIKEMTKF